jgi:tripartite-type tricarboxylate transporter receptor subunit TctC
MKLARRQFLHLAAAATLPAVSRVAGAQGYPTRPVRVIVGFAPGQALDIVTRIIAQRLSERLGEQFIIDNRPGAGGTIGASVVKNARPDGYTLLFSPSTFVSTPMTMPTPPYDAAKDFTPVALVAKAPLAIAVRSDLPFNDVKGLIAYAKANPGNMTFAIGSSASAGHMSTELLKRAGGIEYLIVPYKGSGPAYQDLIGGRIDAFIDPILGSSSHAKAGKLKVIAVTSKERVPALPNTPTVGETVPGYEFYSWYGLWGPAKMPKEIADRLNAEVNKALNGDMKAKLVEQGLLLTPGSIDDFVKFQQEDTVKIAKIIKDANIKAE